MRREQSGHRDACAKFALHFDPPSISARPALFEWDFGETCSLTLRCRGCPDDDYANVESQPASAPAHPLHAGHPDENHRPIAITLGATAPTLILEAVYLRSIYQTEHPRNWDFKDSNQEPSRGHTQNQAPNPSSPSTEAIGSQIAQGHAADGTKQSEQNPIPNPVGCRSLNVCRLLPDSSR
jgi:hypothetical protein